MSNKAKAVIFMLLSALTFAVMSVFIRFAGDIPPAEKVIIRTIFSAFILFFVLKREKLPLWGKRWNQKLLISRSLLGVIGILFYFYGINYVILADASMISRLNPFFVTFFAWFFLHERLPRLQLFSLLIVFLASLLIIKPQFNSSFLPSLAIVGAAVFTGASHTIVRALHFKEHPLTIVFYFSFASTIFLLPFVILDFVLPTGIQWIYLIGISAMGLFSQIFLTFAFRLAPASEVSIYSYSIIIFGAIFGYVFWGEVSDIYSIIGGVIIVIVSIILYIKQKHTVF